MNWQLFDAFGVFLGFTANLVFSNAGPSSWRYQMASSALPTVCLLSLILVIPESPRWLLKQGRLSDAFMALVALRETPLQAAIELFYANVQIQAEVNLLPQRSRDTEIEAQSYEATHVVSQKTQSKHDQVEQSYDTKEASNEEVAEKGVGRTGKESRNIPLKASLASIWQKITKRVDDAELDQFQRRVRSTNYWGRIWQLFRDKRTRRATIAALVVMISQQLCGV